jgi:hypothetical protein
MASLVNGLIRQAVAQQHTAAAAVLLQYAAGRQACHQPPLEGHQDNTQQQQQQRDEDWLDPATLSAFLVTAIQQGCSSMYKVCMMTAIQELLPSCTVFSLLEFAVKNDPGIKGVSALTWLSAAQQLQPEAVVELLLQALQCGNIAAARTICDVLPAASRLSEATNVWVLMMPAAAMGVLGTVT